MRTRYDLWARRRRRRPFIIAVVLIAATSGCSRIAAEELLVVEDVPVLAVRELRQVCLSLGRDQEFGASCMDGSAEEHVNILGSAAGMAAKGVLAGRVPSTVTHVTIDQEGEQIARVDVTETSFGRFFAAEVPGVGTYRVVAVMEDGANYGSADVEVREDATTGVQFDQGDAPGP